MKQQWYRTAPLQAAELQKEIWAAGGKEFTMEITYGKPVDIISFKKSIVENFAKNVDYKKSSAAQLLTAEHTEKVLACPVCGRDAQKKKPVFQVYGASYIQCDFCTHCFLAKKLSQNSLTDYFQKDTEYRATYNDKTIAETRVTQVAMPKLEWTLQQFKRVYGRTPKGILDVGAGSGHFVYACGKKNIPNHGIEISPQGRNFCKQVFDIEMLYLDFKKDFKKIAELNFEIITFWGVIECVSDPSDMMGTAAKLLNNRPGMVVVEVPRWNSLSTTVQKFFPGSVIRHLDPIGHIHMFTDTSLLQLLDNNKIQPVSAWYFGMDSYELITQLAFALKNENVIEELRNLIPHIQLQVDKARLSDEIVVAGVTNS